MTRQTSTARNAEELAADPAVVLAVLRTLSATDGMGVSEETIADHVARAGSDLVAAHVATMAVGRGMTWRALLGALRAAADAAGVSHRLSSADLADVLAIRAVLERMEGGLRPLRGSLFESVCEQINAIAVGRRVAVDVEHALAQIRASCFCATPAKLAANIAEVVPFWVAAIAGGIHRALGPTGADAFVAELSKRCAESV